jgi:hypothetical protein
MKRFIKPSSREKTVSSALKTARIRRPVSPDFTVFNPKTETGFIIL